MENTLFKPLENSFFADHPSLVSQQAEIMEACTALIRGYEANKKLLVCGNGGSSSDADHIVGELMKGFVRRRPLNNADKDKFTPENRWIADKLQYGLPAISLNAHTALTSAFANDVDPQLVFAQQVMGYGVAGDLFIGISTSGDAANVVAAAKTAQAKQIKTIGLTGRSGGKLGDICDITIVAPHHETYRIQELHISIYHFICAYVEAYFFSV